MRISYCSSDVCSSDLLQYLLIGAVEAGIDKAVRRSLPLDGDVLEETFACRRAFKDEGRGQEDRRLQRAFGKRGIEPVAHHQRGGLQLAAAEFQDIGLRAATRRRNSRGTVGIVRAGHNKAAPLQTARGRNSIASNRLARRSSTPFWPDVLVNSFPW